MNIFSFNIYLIFISFLKHNDSGVDIRNGKQLPEPPQSTNQVYAFVKRVKNFIASKKSPNSTGPKPSGSQQKIYEDSAQFYVDENEYQNTPKAPVRSKSLAKIVKKPTMPKDLDDDIYENTDFHSPPIINESSTLKKINKLEMTSPTQDPNELTLRSKSKTGKSFKARLRKSLVGASFDPKNLGSGTLVTTRSTFYVSDDIVNDGSGELDSGFSEKGDLNGNNQSDLPVECPKLLTVSRKNKKDENISNAHRRRTSIGIRPNDPPPPPPPVSLDDNVKKRHHRSSTTSWYAECGVFKNGTSTHDDNSGKASSQSGNSSGTGGGTTSWYTEAGLYQTSGASVASSSGSSGVSTGNEACPGEDIPHSMFLNEPLYQIYNAAKLEVSFCFLLIYLWVI